MGEAASLRNIGYSQIQLANKKAAVESLEKSLGVYKKIYAADNKQPCVGDTLHYLGVALQMPPKADLKRSLEHLKRALSIKQHALDSAHPSLAETLSQLGSTYQDLGDYAQAVEHLEPAAVIYKSLSLDDYFHDVAFVMNSLGMCKRGLGDYAGSIEDYRQALNIYSKWLGDEHANTRIVRENLEKSIQMSQAKDEKSRKKSLKGKESLS